MYAALPPRNGLSGVNAILVAALMAFLGARGMRSTLPEGRPVDDELPEGRALTRIVGPDPSMIKLKSLKNLTYLPAFGSL